MVEIIGSAELASRTAKAEIPDIEAVRKEILESQKMRNGKDMVLKEVNATITKGIKELQGFFQIDMLDSIPELVYDSVVKDLTEAGYLAKVQPNVVDPRTGSPIFKPDLKGRLIIMIRLFEEEGDGADSPNT